MKVLWVGDPHVTRAELDDALVLQNIIEEAEAKYQPDFTLLAGDLYDNFGVKDVEVERFWQNFFLRGSSLVQPFHRVCLVGNHDRPGDQSVQAHALQVHESGYVTVVDSPRHLSLGNAEAIDVLTVMPYIADPREFERQAIELGGDVLFCHQELLGVTYAGGHMPTNVADPAKLPQKLIISGHIHTPMHFRKVWYPGAPRWRTVADANIDRHIHLLEIDHMGVVDKAKIPTSDCRRIWAWEESPGAPHADFNVRARDRIIVDLRGPKDFVETRRNDWAGKTNVRLRVFPTDGPSPKVAESDGVENAFVKHVTSYQTRYGTSPETIFETYKERSGHV